MQNVTYWLLVDTLRVQDVYTQIIETLVIKNSVPLFKGSDFDYLLEQSPLLVELGPDTDVLNKWLSLPFLNINSVIFKVDENVHQDELLSHLQALLIAYIDGHKMLFRYYTNAMWCDVKKNKMELDPLDLIVLLGPAQSFYWVDDKQQIQSISRTLIPYVQYKSLAVCTLISPYFKQWI
jgi:hypothetical protein